VKLVDIIIIKYGLPELEAECVKSVLDYTYMPYHLTVYDNYVKDEYLSVVWNRLIRQSTADYICLLNNDTRVENMWIDKLVGTLGLHPELGVVGPVTNRCAGPQNGFNKAVNRPIQFVKYLSGFCCVFPKKVWEVVGGFNEEYVLYGEDSEFFDEVRRKGYKLAVQPDVFIFHHRSQSKKVAEKRGKNIDKIRHKSNEKYERRKKERKAK